jgi:AhpD family alkylhydroperoxidase
MKGFATVAQAATEANALDAKTKELIALAIAVATRCDDCIAFHAKAALQHGASRAETLETLGMAIYMGAGPAVMYASHAIEASDQLHCHGSASVGVSPRLPGCTSWSSAVGRVGRRAANCDHTLTSPRVAWEGRAAATEGDVTALSLRSGPEPQGPRSSNQAVTLGASYKRLQTFLHAQPWPWRQTRRCVQAAAACWTRLALPTIWMLAGAIDVVASARGASIATAVRSAAVPALRSRSLGI